MVCMSHCFLSFLYNIIISQFIFLTDICSQNLKICTQCPSLDDINTIISIFDFSSAIECTSCIFTHDSCAEIILALS